MKHSKKLLITGKGLTDENKIQITSFNLYRLCIAYAHSKRLGDCIRDRYCSTKFDPINNKKIKDCINYYNADVQIVNFCTQLGTDGAITLEACKKVFKLSDKFINKKYTDQVTEDFQKINDMLQVCIHNQTGFKWSIMYYESLDEIIMEG